MDSSQRGGESNFRGMGYQKKVIAYFATQMLRGRLPITKIICEYLDDIEIHCNDSNISHYQVLYM